MHSKPAVGPVVLNNTPLIDQLLAEGLFLTPDLVQKALELAGET